MNKRIYTIEEAKQRDAECKRRWRINNRDKKNARERERRAARSPEERDHDRETRRCWYKNNPHLRTATRKKCYTTTPEIWILSNIRSRCRRLGVPCNIDLEDIKPPERCPILGIELRRNLLGSESPKKGPIPNSPAVDRIDPRKGYIKGNIQIISHLANCIKQNATPDQIIKVGVYMKKLQEDTGYEMPSPAYLITSPDDG